MRATTGQGQQNQPGGRRRSSLRRRGSVRPQDLVNQLFPFGSLSDDESSAAIGSAASTNSLVHLAGEAAPDCDCGAPKVSQRISAAVRSPVGGLITDGPDTAAVQAAPPPRASASFAWRKKGKLSSANGSNGSITALPTLRIIDARPELSAKGNSLIGKGHEVVSRLGQGAATLQFADMGNIKVVRNSFNALVAALDVEDDPSWHQSLHASGWLLHIRSLMKGATAISQLLEAGDPVLVHCSDGWDRTAQLCSLSQILSDPYFRTIEGLQILIQKDWEAFGYQFRSRIGFGAAGSEISPVFVQWLDAVWQVLQQFPSEFEYQESLLLTLLEAAYSRWFCDFLCDTEKATREHCCQSEDSFISVWALIDHMRAAFENPLYRYASSTAASSEAQVLEPNSEVRALSVWTAAYLSKTLGQRKWNAKSTREVFLSRVVVEQQRELEALRALNTNHEMIGGLRMGPIGGLGGPTEAAECTAEGEHY
ncbi:unnamed protein product [Chrysoparadoxa australica]